VTDRQYIARFMERTVITPKRCFVWTGTESTKGYAMVSYRNKTWLLHRLSHIIHLGPIIPGKLVCHTCDVRRCWNPDHLWLGTNKENMVDCSRKGRADDQWRTTCMHGHPFDEENTYHIQMTETVKRACKRCQLIRARLRMGWPTNLAWTLPKTPRGYTRHGEPCKKSH
jgi:hypothetical protein